MTLKAMKAMKGLCLFLIGLPLYLSTSAPLAAENLPLRAPEDIHKSFISKDAASPLTEISGIAASSHDNALLWGINDSGNGPYLYAISNAGSVIRRFKIEGAKNNDWEALTSYKDENGSFLIIADIGDNRGRKALYNLYIIKEPDLKAKSANVKIERMLSFMYEKGARDAEAMAVSVAEKKIYISEKRKKPTTLYSLPLYPERNPEQNAVLVPFNEAELTYFLKPPPEDTFKFKNYIFGQQPTDMSISPDGKMAALLTYPYIYIFQRNAKEDWSEAFKTPQAYIKTQNLKQAESITFSKDSQSLFVSSEEKPTPLYHIKLSR